MSISSTLIYGRTGEGKTALLGAAAQWVFNTTGKITRIYSGEDGRLGTIQHLIDLGRIEVLDVKKIPNASEVLDQISKGWWLSPRGEMVPPTVADWERIGLVAYEGMTEFAEMVLDELSVKGSNNQIMGAEKAPAVYMSGKLKVAGANETYYGIAQRLIHRAVGESQLLPPYVVWTAREKRVIERDTKQPMCGPQIAGKAATLDAPSWFGNTIHVDRITVMDARTKSEKLERRVYLQSHLDPETKVPYVAQVRVAVGFASEVPEYVMVDHDEAAMVGVFAKLEELRVKAREKLK